jgi:hypothetical protein
VTTIPITRSEDMRIYRHVLCIVPPGASFFGFIIGTRYVTTTRKAGFTTTVYSHFAATA